MPATREHLYRLLKPDHRSQSLDDMRGKEDRQAFGLVRYPQPATGSTPSNLATGADSEAQDPLRSPSSPPVEVNLTDDHVNSICTARARIAAIVQQQGVGDTERTWAERNRAVQASSLKDEFRKFGRRSTCSDDEVERLIRAEDLEAIKAMPCSKIQESPDALLFALSFKSVDIAMAILNKQCAGLMHHRMEGGHGQTSLHMAVQLGNLDLVKKLLDTVPERECKLLLKTTTPVKILEYSWIRSHSSTSASLTPFQLAALGGSLEIVRHFVDNKLAFSESTFYDHGNRVRDIALALAILRKHTALAEYLMRHFSREYVDTQGMTILHYAILSGSCKMVQLVLDKSETTDFTVYFFRASSNEGPLAFAVHIEQPSIQVIEMIMNKVEPRAFTTPNGMLGTVRDTFLHTLTRDCPDDMAARLMRLAISLCREGPAPKVSMVSSPSSLSLPRQGKAARGGVIFSASTKILGESSTSLAQSGLLLKANALHETPFLLAVRFNKPKTMLEMACEVTEEVLSIVDTHGKHVFDYAIDEDEDTVLIHLLEIFKMKYQVHRDMEHLYDLASYTALGRQRDSPLHIAASLGDLRKIELIMSYLNYPNIANLNEDNFLHCAARHGRVNILRSAFSRPTLLNQKNKAGNTVLHLACLCGQEAAAQAVLDKANLTFQNEHGQTVLHVATLVPELTSNFVGHLFDKMASISPDLVLVQDHKGRTALHNLAGMEWKAGRERLIEKFCKPSTGISAMGVTDRNHDSPLHVAIRGNMTHNVQALLQWRSNLSIANDLGFSLLHEAVVSGAEIEVVELLLASGVVPHRVDSKGKTPLHLLIDILVEDPTNERHYVEVFKCILANSARSYNSNGQYQPGVALSPPPSPSHPSAAGTAGLPSSYTDHQLLTKAIHLLVLTGTDQQLPPILYAAKCGARAILDVIMTYKGVFMLDGEDEITRTILSDPRRHCLYYDVTNFLPATATFGGHSSHYEAHKDQDTEGLKGKSSSSSDADRSSLVKIIVESKNMENWKQLESEPLLSYVEGYWQPFRYLYTFLFFIHVAYMFAFSHVTIDILDNYVDSCYLVNFTRSEGEMYPFDVATCEEAPSLYYLFAIWPASILFLNISNLFFAVYRCIYQRNKVKQQRGHAEKFWWTDIGTFEIIERVFVHLVSYTFALTTATFMVLHYLKSMNQIYFLTLSLVSGWIFTINFTKGFKALHYFIFTLQRIIFQDIFKFGIMFIIFFLAYAYAFHAILRYVPAFSRDYEHLYYTVFKTFNLALGYGDFFAPPDHRDYPQRLEGFFDFVGASFFIICIVLLNILIAVMNDSYHRTNVRSKLHWKVSKLKQALTLDQHLPLLSKLVRGLHCGRSGHQGNVVVSLNDKRLFFELKKSDLAANYRSHIGDNEEIRSTLSGLVATVTRMKSQLDKSIPSQPAAGSGRFPTLVHNMRKARGNRASP